MENMENNMENIVNTDFNFLLLFNVQRREFFSKAGLKVKENIKDFLMWKSLEEYNRVILAKDNSARSYPENPDDVNRDKYELDSDICKIIGDNKSLMIGQNLFVSENYGFSMGTITKIISDFLVENLFLTNCDYKINLNIDVLGANLESFLLSSVIMLLTSFAEMRNKINLNINVIANCCIGDSSQSMTSALEILKNAGVNILVLSKGEKENDC